MTATADFASHEESPAIHGQPGANLAAAASVVGPSGPGGPIGPVAPLVMVYWTRKLYWTQTPSRGMSRVFFWLSTKSIVPRLILRGNGKALLPTSASLAAGVYRFQVVGRPSDGANLFQITMMATTVKPVRIMFFDGM